MSTQTFTTAHASGLWTAPRQAWAQLEHDLARLATLVTYTETTTPGAIVGRRAGWDHYPGDNRPGANENTITWDHDTWDPLGPGFTEAITQTLYALGNGHTRPPVHATVQPLQHTPTSRQLAVIVIHAPSAIQGRGRLIGGVRRTIANLEMYAGLRRLRRRLRQQHPGIAFLIVGDWNLDHRLAWVRALLRTRVGLRNAWHKLPPPHRGTHGRRVIDAGRHSRHLKTNGTELLHHRPPFDHTPTRTTYQWRPRKTRNTPS